MKAAFFTSFGPADEVFEYDEISAVSPRPHEITVSLRASGVNPSDTKKRAGLRHEVIEDCIVPHSDGSGIITSVGSEVTDRHVGQRVWLFEAQHQRSRGTAAHAITLPAHLSAPLPENTSFAEGAALGVPLMTAHRCLTLCGPLEGQWVLVTGAQGRVGFYAVQIAQILGANVIASVSNPEQAQELEHCGVQHIISHHPNQFKSSLAEFCEQQKIGLNLVVDVEFGQNLEHYVDCLENNASITTYGSMLQPSPELPFYSLMFKNINLHTLLVYAMPDAAKKRAIEDITQWLEQNKIHHRIAKTYPLEQISNAHQCIENNQCKGSVIIKIEPADIK